MPGTATPITDWYTTSQAATILGVSPTRIIQLANYGRLPCIRLGNGTRLFNPADVTAEAERRAAA